MIFDEMQQQNNIWIYIYLNRRTFIIGNAAPCYRKIAILRNSFYGGLSAVINNIFVCSKYNKGRYDNYMYYMYVLYLTGKKKILMRYN